MPVVMVVSACARLSAQMQPADSHPPSNSASEWRYGTFLDLGYTRDFNDPANHVFRSRGTTARVNDLDVNMVEAHLKKDAVKSSPWGIELGLQTGNDSRTFGFSATAPDLGGARILRHISAANVSYLAPLGSGLKLQGGIFSSLVGYDSLYSKDNLNYTRPWGTDYTPYLMMGINASYDFTRRLSGTLLVINGYWHLAHANNIPTSGGQVAYKPTPHVTWKQTVLYGPHQASTDLPFWRLLSDSSIEHRGESITAALEYLVGTERTGEGATHRALWTAAQLPLRWSIQGPWSVAVRPEVFWDRDGRWTGFRQTVKAFTTTIEYRFAYRFSSVILRVEHRYDDSRGPGGGFYKGPYLQSGEPALVPAQHLLIVAAVFSFDSSFHR
jgi:Putative beta-barrel porin-2, OmpL-like. bbp2